MATDVTQRYYTIHIDKSICTVPHLRVSCHVSTLMYLIDITEYEYTNHMWVICSMYMCSVYLMYINVNTLCFHCVCVGYRRIRIHESYAFICSMYMCSISDPMYIHVKHKCVCERLVLSGGDLAQVCTRQAGQT